jgi:hypothetical protein
MAGNRDLEKIIRPNESNCELRKSVIKSVKESTSRPRCNPKAISNV